MDPTSAIGLAASIVQLTCFAGDLLSKTREIKDSADGALVENQELEAVTSSLQELSRDLSAGSRNLTKADKQLKALCDGCQSATDDLLDVVQKLRTSSSHKGWESFRQAVLTVWKEKQVRSLTERLERYRGQINLALLVTLNESMGRLGSTIAGSTSNVRRRNYGNVSPVDWIGHGRTPSSTRFDRITGRKKTSKTWRCSRHALLNQLEPIATTYISFALSRIFDLPI